MTSQNSKELKEQGYTIIRNIVNKDWINILENAVDKAFIEHRRTQIENNNDIQTDGVALHVLLSDPIFIQFLEYLITLCFKLMFFQNNQG